MVHRVTCREVFGDESGSDERDLRNAYLCIHSVVLFAEIGVSTWSVEGDVYDVAFFFEILVKLPVRLIHGTVGLAGSYRVEVGVFIHPRDDCAGGDGVNVWRELESEDIDIDLLDLLRIRYWWRIWDAFWSGRTGRASSCNRYKQGDGYGRRALAPKKMRDVHVEYP